MGAVIRRLLAVLAAGVVVVSSLSLGAAASFAAVTDNCAAETTQNSLKVTPNHGKIFYIDSGQGQNVDAGYASYTVTNLGATTQSNLWVQVSNFSGGAVSLANSADSAMPVSSLAQNAKGSTFFLLKATNSSASQQSHQVRVFSGKPGIGSPTLLYSCTFAFSKVAETIKAAANKVNSMTQLSASTLTIGDKFIVKVAGDTGTIGSGNTTDPKALWFSPTARSTWPTQSLRLESSSIAFFKQSGNNAPTLAGTFTNDLLVTLDDLQALSGVSQGTKAFPYEATYTFRIVGNTVSAVKPSPVAQIASGTQMKHTDMASVDTAANSAFSGGVSVSTPIPLAVTKSVSNTVSTSGGFTTFNYTVSLANSGSTDLSVDQIVDAPSTGMSYVAGSARFGGAATNEPVVDSSGKLVFVGPYTVPVGTRTLTYQMRVAACGSGSATYSNSVFAQLGTVTIGSTATAYQQLTATVTCGSNSISSSTTPISLPVEVVTSPATNVLTTSATLNGTVDSNGTADLANSFQWGTSPTLATFTSISLAATTTSTSPAPYTFNLTGLNTGTVYYYRIVSGSTQGQIVSFVTSEPVGTPVITTTTVTNLAVSGSGIGATLGANIDPNQIASGVKVRFQWAVDNSGGACTSLGSTTTVPSSSTYIGDGTADVLLSGSFATDMNLDVPDTINTNATFVNGTRYCYRVQGFYSTTAGSFTTTANGDWVAFYAKVRLAQSITFPTPTITNGSGTAGATASSGLTVTYVSQTPDVCTVTSSGSIQVLSAGVCTLTASQPGNVDYEPALDVSISFNVTPGPPVVTTSSLPNGTYGTAYSTSLAAGAGTGVYSSYALVSGTLPAGLTFNSNGTITGTPTAATVSAVTLGFTVTDSGNTTSVTKSLTLTIARATLTVTAPSPTVSYGDSKPTLDPTYSGFVLSDTSSVVTSAPTCDVSYTTTTPVSSSGLAVTCTGGSASNYLFSYVAGTLTITRATVTVTAPSLSRTYGDPVGTIGSPTYSGWKNSQTESVLTASPTCVTTYTSSSTVGSSPTVTCSGAAAANYQFSYVAGTVVVSRAPQTITFGTASSMQPGDTRTITTTTTSGSTATVTYVSGDCTYDAATGVATASASLSNPIAPCVLSASVGSSTNYLAAGPTTFTINLSRIDQTITVSNFTKTYGDTNFAAGASASSGLTVSLSSGNTAVATVSGGTITIQGVGTATITATQAGNGTYNAATTRTFTVTVQPAELTVTAPSHSLTYGDAKPTLTPTYAGFKYSDTSSSLTSPVACSTAYTNTTGATATPIAVTCSGAASPNYTIRYVAGAITVAKAPLTVTAPSLSRDYGDPVGSVGSPTYAGWVNGQDDSALAARATCTTTYTDTSAVGSSPSVTCSGAASSNYDISYVAGVVVISKAPQTITPGVYAAMLPGDTRTLTPSATSGTTPTVTYVSGDCSYSSVTGVVTASNPLSSPPVACVLSVSVGSSANYLAAGPVTLTINVTNVALQNQTISANNIVRTYGASAHTPTVTASSGLAVSLSSADSHIVSVSGGQLTFAGVGTVTITATQAGNSSYNPASTTFTVTVEPAVITVQAPDATVEYGSSLGALTPSYAGWVNGDGESDLSAHASCSSTYTTSTAVSQTPSVTCASAAASNYTFEYLPGTVTITKALVTVTAPSPTRAYGSAVGTLTPTYSGWVNGQNAGSLTTVPVCVTTYTASTNAGQTRSVTCSGAAASNYRFTYVAGTLTVTRANQTITANNVTVTYGDDDLTPTVTNSSGETVTLSSANTLVASVLGNGRLRFNGVGTVTITASHPGNSNLNAAANVTFTVTVLPATLTVTGPSGTVLVGSVTPNVTPTILGFKQSDSTRTLQTAPTCTTTHSSAAAAGSTHAVVCSGGVAANYQFSYVNGVIRVVAAPATVTPVAAPTPLRNVLPVTPVLPAPATPVTPAPRLNTVVPNNSPAGIPLAVPVTPKAPTVSQQVTVDAGTGATAGPVAVSPVAAAVAQQSTATRTTDQLKSETLGGFTGGSGVQIQVSGARTTAQFILSNAGAIDTPAIAAALTESTARNQSEFAAISSIAPVSNIAPNQITTGPVTQDAKDLFEASGLRTPVTLGSLDVSGADHWVSVDANVRGYLPGTVVYLAVTTDPIIFGSAVVGEDGTAVLDGNLALDVLEPAAHNIRIVGTRDLGGVQVGADGELQLSDETTREIQKFDRGTNAVVVLAGTSSTGGHTAVRLVPLIQVVPWWTLWIYLAACALVLLLAARFRRNRMVRIGALVTVTVGALLPLIAAWVTFSYVLFVPTGLTFAIALGGLLLLRRGRGRGPRLA